MHYLHTVMLAYLGFVIYDVFPFATFKTEHFEKVHALSVGIHNHFAG